jgi:hypothetical protein
VLEGGGRGVTDRSADSEIFIKSAEKEDVPRFHVLPPDSCLQLMPDGLQDLFQGCGIRLGDVLFIAKVSVMG